MDMRWRWALVLLLVNISFCKEEAKTTKEEDEKAKEKAAKKEKDEEESEEGPAQPGDPNYYTKLLGLGFSEGTLQKVESKDGKMYKSPMTKKSFDPDWFDYQLTIKSGKSKELLVTPMLNVRKYDLLNKPVLKFEGKEQKYSPIQNIEFPLELNRDNKGKSKNPGPLDRDVTLEVADPKGGSNGVFGVGGSIYSHTYRIRVRQAPDIENIVTATAIEVMGISDSGVEKKAEGLHEKNPYDPKSPHNEIRYIVDENVKKVRVTVTCPSEATDLKYNGRSFDAGHAYTSQEFEGTTKSILGQCLYKSKDYTDSQEMQRTYVITVARTANINMTHVDLRLWPPGQMGGCVKHHEEGKRPGWRCMKGPPDAQFVGSYDNPKAELVVVNTKTKGRYRLWNGIPTSIPVPEDEHDDELVLEAGINQQKYTFLFGPPPSCKTMQWTGDELRMGPHNKSLTDHWQSQEHHWKKFQVQPNASWKCPMVKDHDGSLRPQEINNETMKLYCNWKPCTHPIDDLACCRSVKAPCWSYDPAVYGEMQCPGSLVFHPEQRCTGFPCKNTQRDIAQCCHPKSAGAAAPCNSMECPMDSVVVEGGGSLSCFGNPCGKADAATCCEQRAICNTMACPAGFSLKYNAALYLCLGAHCQILDRDTCCDAAAYCSEFQCPGPGGTLANSGAALFKSPLGWQLKSTASEIPCGGDPCIEWDTGICCNRVGFCSTLQCQTGYYPKKNGAHIPCDGGVGKRKCTMHDDLGTCCSPAARCKSDSAGSYSCPFGYSFKLAAQFITCPGADCTENDRNLCCDMVNPFEAAEETTTLLARTGEGTCHMEEGPTTWTCNALGDRLHLTVNYTFDQPVENKVFMQGNMVSGQSAAVKLPEINVMTVGSNPVHASVHSRTSGRGPAEHRLTIFVHAAQTPPSAPAAPAKEPSEKKEESKESEKSKDSKESKDSKADTHTIKENTLRERRMNEVWT